MTSDAFNQLSLQKQLAYLQQQGLFVEAQRQGKFAVHLYRLPENYVQIWIDLDGYEIYQATMLPGHCSAEATMNTRTKQAIHPFVELYLSQK